jgi:excisionase family DNA binding protein
MAVTNRTENENPDLLTVPEAARELRCSKAHVHNLINGTVSGTEPLPAICLGRRRLIRRASLNDWLLSCEHRQKSTPQTHERTSDHA